MKIIFYLILSFLFCLPLQAGNYRIAIFDYDIRPTGAITIATYIEKQLRNTDMNISEINHFSGGESEQKSRQILKMLDKRGYDLIITITSDLMVPAGRILRNTPWLFTNVNNPLFFGIEDLGKPGKNRSGVTYYIPVANQIIIFNQVMNNKIRKVGLLFDKHAKSRRVELSEFRDVCSEMGLSYEIELVSSVDDLSGAVMNLISKQVDIIIVTSSDYLYNNIDKFLTICNENKVPVFSVNKNGVKNGAVAALASDYFRMVDECLIPMIFEVLVNKKNPGDMPVRYIENSRVYLNMSQIRLLGLNVTENILEKSEHIN